MSEREREKPQARERERTNHNDITTMFANRLRKDARHLAKWAKRTGVTCWRVYDRDIPEVPVTVDTYEGALVINDYRIDPSDRGWLDELVAAAKQTLDASDAFVKQRERLVGRRDGHQYERLDDPAVWRIVAEGGHKFRVNLSSYVDTGLFLDHRITRARAAGESGFTMLNLYSYTGAFTVYAAAAGKHTTSVDLSRTYLDWAEGNLALNGLTGELIQADVREYLTDARRAGVRWDVVVVDPPTFSNSKRMDYTFDIQRDHAALLDDVRGVLNPGGTIWFSSNRKKLRFEPDGYTDETRATTPPDFRHRPHAAFRLTTPP